ncbi:hypothetical protein [Vibrio campbellii]|uniref:hypothetical protein n=1 Tax=Vibrio campbellii TaxID=680 RepID=UPI0005EEDD9F|nr:hypothetical protein [Vibrio campbellii]
MHYKSKAQKAQIPDQAQYRSNVSIDRDLVAFKDFMMNAGLTVTFNSVECCGVDLDKAQVLARYENYQAIEPKARFVKFDVIWRLIGKKKIERLNNMNAAYFGEERLKELKMYLSDEEIYQLAKLEISDKGDSNE